MPHKVGEIEVFGTGAFKVRVHISPPGALEIGLIFKEALVEEASLQFNGRTLYTTTEREPEEEKLFGAACKARAFCRPKLKHWQPRGFASAHGSLTGS